MYAFMRFLPEFDLNLPEYGETINAWHQDWASAFSLSPAPLFNQSAKVSAALPAPLFIGENLTTTRISVANDGTQANSSSSVGAISADGRYVAFSSLATNLVAGDTNMKPDIFIYDRNTDTIEILPLVGGVFAGGQMSLSSDGRYITFRSPDALVAEDINDNIDIFVYDRDTDVIELLSITDSGIQGNNSSIKPSISDDGRYVVFESLADNLVAFDTNTHFDIFVVDRVTDDLIRVNVSSGGVEANNFSSNPEISGDGLFVVFQSEADNLVAGDSNGADDIFVYDLTAGSLERVSLTNGGGQANDISLNPSISSDGRYVVFESFASNLVAGDTNAELDVFVHDRLLNTTERVSIASDGTQANGGSGLATISADGRYISFASAATNLVAGDSNGFADIFVYDRTTGNVQLVSAASDGTQADIDSLNSVVSADGSFVVYETSASNLVAGDTNGFDDIFITEIAAGGSGSTFNGTSGDDTLAGDTGDDTVNGEAGNDRLFGQGGNDILNGGDGNDQLWGGPGADTLNGGAGIDGAYYILAPSGVTLNTVTGGTGGEAAGDSYSGIERFYGSQFGDTMVGGAGVDILFGLGGDDALSGGGGNDLLYGHGGADTLNGDAGIDRLFGGAGNDILNGGADDDFLYGQGGDDTLNGHGGNDTLVGGAGIDTINGGDGADILRGQLGADILSGDGGDDLLFGDEGDDTLNGGDGIDILRGHIGADTLGGDGGNDLLFGDDGDDILNGGSGNDSLWGGIGADTLDGGAGIDRALYSTASSSVTVSLAAGGSVGDAAGDTFVSIENLYGSQFGDILEGDAGDNLIAGLGGVDIIDGGTGNDRLFGGAGDDVLTGGAGNDLLFGQGGVDIFKYDSAAFGNDKISGFEQGVDIINFTAASGITAFGDLTITQVGSNVLITTAAGTILALSQTAADFTAADFTFTPAAEQPSSKQNMAADLPNLKQDELSEFFDNLPIDQEPMTDFIDADLALDGNLSGDISAQIF